MFDELSPPYGCVVVDPPWDYGITQRLSGRSRKSAAASAHYSTLPIGDLAAMPVGSLVADAAHLWLWVTNARLAAGDHTPLLDAWGFRPLTIVTWCKNRPGLGLYVRNSTEHLVLGVRGWYTCPETPARSTWEQWDRARHSVKPAAALDLIEQVSPGPYVELFARAPRLGWDSWGRGYETVDSA